MRGNGKRRTPEPRVDSRALSPQQRPSGRSRDDHATDRPAGRTAQLRRLAEAIRAIEASNGAEAATGRSGGVLGAVSLGIPGGAHSPGAGAGVGVARGAIHEWFGLAGPDPASRGWTPPLGILIHLAWQALEQASSDSGGQVIWIGRRIWPHPRALILFSGGSKSRVTDRTGVRCLEGSGGTGGHGALADKLPVAPGGEQGRDLLCCSVFIDPPDDASRLWAIDLALRCPAVVAVVADGRGFELPQTRRLQLAAEAGAVLGLLGRPPGELERRSTASTRWRVRPVPGPRPRWAVELLRCKGAHRQTAAARRDVGDVGDVGGWMLELDRVKGVVSALAEVGDRSGAPAVGAAASRRRTA